MKLRFSYLRFYQFVILCMYMYSSKELRRPRRLLVFINPIGGNGKATRVFNDQVAPLFDIAGIDTTVIGKYSYS